MSENQFQAELFQWAWNSFPAIRRLLWAVPNGQYRHHQERALFQATGVIAGVYDLHLYYSGKLYCFELKVDNNSRSAAQVEWARLMTAQGATCYEISEKNQGREKFKSIIAGIIAGYDVKINFMPD